MLNTKTLIIGSLLAVIAALFQSVPVLFSEIFVLVTVFSAIPIYIVSRINPKAGILSYFVASIIVMLISTHEGLFFLCTNGIIGVSLGICNYYTKRKINIWFISSIILTAALSVMNYGIGIPVFATKIPGGLLIQLIYCFYSQLYIILFTIIFQVLYLIFLIDLMLLILTNEITVKKLLTVINLVNDMMNRCD